MDLQAEDMYEELGFDEAEGAAESFEEEDGFEEMDAADEFEEMDAADEFEEDSLEAMDEFEEFEEGEGFEEFEEADSFEEDALEEGMAYALAAEDSDEFVQPHPPSLCAGRRAHRWGGWASPAASGVGG